MIYKDDCFGYSVKSNAHTRCMALTAITCDCCKFYKTKEQFHKDREKSEMICKKRGVNRDKYRKC